jgi:hypothetical protein
LNVRELADRQVILDILHRYCRGVDRLDKSLIGSAYFPDAWDDHGTFKARGSECADVIIERIAKQADSSMHCISNVLFEVAGIDVIHTEAYFIAWLAFRRGEQPYTRTLGGRYVDRFERRRGRWAIANRVVVHEFSRIDPVVELWPSSSNMHTGARSREDITYTKVQLDREPFVSDIYYGPTSRGTAQ